MTFFEAKLDTSFRLEGRRRHHRLKSVKFFVAPQELKLNCCQFFFLSDPLKTFRTKQICRTVDHDPIKSSLPLPWLRGQAVIMSALNFEYRGSNLAPACLCFEFPKL